MTGRAMARCPLCGVRVRGDKLLRHRERVHPGSLTMEERTTLEKGRKTPSMGVDQKRRSSPPLQVPPLLRPPALASEEVEGEWDVSPVMEGFKRMQRLSDRTARPDVATPELWAKVEEAHGILASRGVVRTWEDEDGSQLDFAETCHERWCSLAQGDADEALAKAFEELFEADGVRFKAQYWEGFVDRRNALSGPLSVLREAGERGVLHLAAAMTVDSWASPLAADTLAEMPSGPLRDRAIVEALFLPGDFTPEAGERGVRAIPIQTRWSLFEEVTRTARNDGVELQSLYWTSLFEAGPNDEEERKPTTDLERAILLLYDSGHHAALAAGMDFLMEPMVSGGPRVERILEEGGVARALRVISERLPSEGPIRTGRRS